MTSFQGRRVRIALGVFALLTFALCSASDPEREAKLQAVQSSIDAKSWDEAIAAARDLVEADGEDARAHALLGAALMGKARTEEKVADPVRMEQAKLAGDAAAFFDPSLFRTEIHYDPSLRSQAEAELRLALDQDREIIDPYVRLATLYEETDDFTGEKAVVQAAVEAFPGKEEEIVAMIPFGERRFRSGQYDEALQIFGPIAQALPGNAQASLNHGAALFATGSYDEGIATLEKAAADHPQDGTIGRTLGQMYMFRLRWKEAADTFGRLAPTAAGDRMVPLHQAASLMPIDREAAAGLLADLVKDDPKRSDQITAIAMNLQLAIGQEGVSNDDLVRLAHQLNQGGFPQLGVATAAFIISRDPRSIPGRVMLAFVYDNLRYHDLALAKLKEAEAIIQEDPATAAPFTVNGLAPHFGRVYFNLKDWQEASEWFGRAENLGPLAYAAGVAQENLGDYAGAYRYFRQVIDAGEPAALVEKAQERVATEAYAPYRK